MEITGKIYAIDVTNQVSDTFKKRDLILEYAENPLYPEFIKFEAMQDKVSLLDKFEEGQTVTIGFNIRGRAVTKGDYTNYYNSLVLWKINAADGVDGEPEEVSQETSDDNGDLPF